MNEEVLLGHAEDYKWTDSDMQIWMVHFSNGGNSVHNDRLIREIGVLNGSSLSIVSIQNLIFLVIFTFNSCNCGL